MEVNYEGVSLLSPLNFVSNSSNNNDFVIEIQIIYKENNFESHAELSSDNASVNNISNYEEVKSSALSLYKKSAKIRIPREKIKGTFIEKELKNSEDNYLKIELKAKKNKIVLENILHCFEYIFEGYTFHYNKENLISYFHAFSICKLLDKRTEVLEKLIKDLSDENVVYFIKVISSLNDDSLNSYSYWLIRHVFLNLQRETNIIFNGYNFNNIVKIREGTFSFDDRHIIYFNEARKFTLSANVSFLQKYYMEYQSEHMKKLINPNNYFNMGKVVRTKSDDNLVNDYPHYYQIIIENDPTMVLFAIRTSENSNFVISRSIDDFTKYGMNYVGEVVPNFWGTHFDIFDNGFEPSMYAKCPKSIFNQRESLGYIQYETNILGECPRYFGIELKYGNNLVKLSNVKPEWNSQLECYCLNFYGRVKKASARNFQLVYEDDYDNILLQHGKASRDEFNIDFREPISLIQAFAISLVSIGKKRVVS